MGKVGGGYGAWGGGDAGAGEKNMTGDQIGTLRRGMLMLMIKPECK